MLKSPFHLGRLDALLAEVPDVTVVQTHRDPGVAVASWCSLAALLANTTSDRVDLPALGRRWLDFWGAEMDRALASRASIDPGRFHDVVYRVLVDDPLGEVERLYARAGLELSAAARRRMASWLRRHHHGRVSRHRYSLDDFGLDHAAVHRRFSRYGEWLGQFDAPPR